MYELSGDYMINNNTDYALQSEDMNTDDYAFAAIMATTTAATVGLIMYAVLKDAPEHSHHQEDNNTSEYQDNKTYQDDNDLLNPANPASPLSPLNPANPVNPLNPINPMYP